MSENSYINIYQPARAADGGGFDLVAMLHADERDALDAASPDMGNYILVAAAIPFINDPERAERTVTQWQVANQQGDVFG